MSEGLSGRYAYESIHVALTGEMFDDWTRIRNEWILIRKNRAKSFKFHQTIYSGQELRDRMLQAGFAEAKLYGNLDGTEYGPQSPRLIAVGRKA